MKTTLVSFILLATLISCSGNSKQSTEKYVAPEKPEDNRNILISLNEMHFSEDVQMGGHTYHCQMDRMPQDTIVITDEDEFRTKDNLITLTVLRDGEAFFSRVLRRNTFNIHLDPSYFRQCILKGIRFNRVTEYGLEFIASIGKGSDDDDFVQFAYTIGADGSTNIVQHEIYEEDEVSRFEDEEM